MLRLFVQLELSRQLADPSANRVPMELTPTRLVSLFLRFKLDTFKLENYL